MSNQFTILLAEDDDDDCMLFTDFVKQFFVNPNLICVTDGRQLINAINDPGFPLPHYIFLDINMPYFNGISCLEHIRSKMAFKNIPVIILTTSSNPQHIEMCFAKGASRYVVKPFSFKVLGSYLHTIFNMNLIDLCIPTEQNFLFPNN